MRFLDNDKSWELFCGKVFGEEDCPVELEEIGKKDSEKMPRTPTVNCCNWGASSKVI